MEHSDILAALEQEDGDLTEIEVDEASAKVEIVCKIYKIAQLGSMFYSILFYQNPLVLYPNF